MALERCGLAFGWLAVQGWALGSVCPEALRGRCAATVPASEGATGIRLRPPARRPHTLGVTGGSRSGGAATWWVMRRLGAALQGRRWRRLALLRGRRAGLEDRATQKGAVRGRRRDRSRVPAPRRLASPHAAPAATVHAACLRVGVVELRRRRWPSVTSASAGSARLARPLPRPPSTRLCSLGLRATSRSSMRPSEWEQRRLSASSTRGCVRQQAGGAGQAVMPTRVAGSSGFAGPPTTAHDQGAPPSRVHAADCMPGRTPGTSACAGLRRRGGEPARRDAAC